MPTAGLSLLGFMSKDLARDYLRQMCVDAPSSAVDFDRRYVAAVNRLGPQFPRAGQPDVHPIPSSHDPYLHGVQANPRFGTAIEIQGLGSWSFKLVEIDPILVYQFGLSKDFARRHSGNLSNPPTLDQMLSVCLPQRLTGEQPIVSKHSNRVQITMKDMNFRLLGGLQYVGNPQDQVAVTGVFCVRATNLAQVVRYNNRTYMKNGVHRGYALRLAGATHMPCLYLEAKDWSALDAGRDRETFGRDLLESANPPCCAHFSQERATDVTLRTMMRIIEVTWSDKVVSDDL
jgi:hypothetical protein